MSNTNSILEAISTNGNEITASASFTSGGSTRVWIAGDFTRVGTRTERGTALQQSGKAMPGTPSINGNVTAVTDDGEGGWYIGGNFTEVGGVAIRNVAHILADGGVDPHFAPAGVVDNSTQKILALDFDGRSGSSATTDAYFDKPRLYVGGNFTWGEANTDARVGAQADIVALNTRLQGVGEGPGSVLDDFVVETHVATSDPGGWDPEVRTILVDPSPAPVANHNSSPGIDDADRLTSRARDNAGVYFGGTFSEISAVRPNGNWMVDMDAGRIAKVEPNGYVAEGVVLRTNTSAFSYGQFMVPKSPSNAAVSIDTIERYDQGIEAGPTLSDGVLRQPTKIIVGGSFSKLGATSWTGSGYTTPVDAVARNLAVIDSVMGTADTQCSIATNPSSCRLTNKVARPIDLNTTGRVSSLAVWAPGSPATTDRLYAAGAVSSVAGKSANRLGEVQLGPAPTSWSAPANPSLNAAVTGSSVSALSLDPASAKLYVTGDFTHFRTLAIARSVRVSIPSGDVDTAWTPGNDIDAAMSIVRASGANTFAAGAFTMVDSVATHRVASVLVGADGTVSVDRGFAQSAPLASFNGSTRITSLSGNADRLYVGGAFTAVDKFNITHANLMALGATSGTIMAGFVANPDTPVRTVRLATNAIANAVWVGGDFQNVTSSSCIGCRNLALLDGSGVQGVNPASGIAPNGPVNAITTDPAGNVYVGGSFSTVGGQGVQRNLVKLTKDGALIESFRDPSGGTTSPVTALVANASSVYAGGVRDWGTFNPRGIVRLDASTSVMEPSFASGDDEGVAAGGAVSTLALDGRRLWVGGTFSAYDNKPQLARLAVVDATRGRPLGSVRPAVSGAVNAITPLGDRTLFGGFWGDFGGRSGVGGLAVTRPALDVTAPNMTVVPNALTSRVKLDTSVTPHSVIAAGVAGLQFSLGVSSADVGPGDTLISGVEPPELGGPFTSLLAPVWNRSLSGTTATFTTNSAATTTQPQTLWVTSADAAGNAAAPYAVRVAIDADPPLPTALTRDESGSSGALLRLVYPSNDDIGLAGVKARFIDRAETNFLNGACPATTPGSYPDTHVKSAGATEDTWSGLGSKCHRFRLRSIDHVDNEAASTPTAWIPVDTQAPTGTVTGSLTRRVQPSFTISGTVADAASGIDRVEATVNGGAPVICLGPVGGSDSASRSYSCPLTVSTGMQHTVVVTAYDDFANPAVLGTLHVTPDATPPVVSSIQLVPMSGTGHQYVVPGAAGGEPTVWIDQDQSGEFRALVTGTDDGPAKLVGGTFPTIAAAGWTNSGGAASTAGGGTTAFYDYSWITGADSSGALLSGSVRDEAGNSSPFAFRVRVDGADPTLSSVVVPSSASSAFDLTAEVRDADVGLKSYVVGLAEVPGGSITRRICNESNTSWGPAVVPVSCRLDLADGAHEIVLEATDLLNRVAEVRRTVTISGRSGLLVSSSNTFPLQLREGESGATEAQRTFNVRLLNPLVDPGDAVVVEMVPPAHTSVRRADGAPGNTITFTQANATAGFDLVVDAASVDDHAYASGQANVVLRVIPEFSSFVVDDATASVVRYDAQQIGIEVDGAPVLHEANNVADTYTVRLTSAPRSTVTMAVNAGSRMTASPALVTFTPTAGGANGWNTPRVITLTPGIDRAFQDGGSESVTATHRISSGDGIDYPTGMNGPNVSATIMDDEVATVTLGAPLTTTIREAGPGSSVTFTAELGGAPSSDVALDFTSAPNDQLQVTGDTVFTPSDWDEPHVITVSSMDDLFSEAPTTTVAVQPSIRTNDPRFASTPDPATMQFTIVDDDIAGVRLVPGDRWNVIGGTLQIAEEDAVGVGVAVQLDTYPLGAVTIAPVSSSPAVAVQPTSVTVDSSWNGIAPTFHIIPQNNAVHAGTVVGGSITWNVTSADAQYGALPAISPTLFSVIDDETPPVPTLPDDRAPRSGEPTLPPTPVVTSPEPVTPKPTKPKDPVKPVEPVEPVKVAEPVQPAQATPVTPPSTTDGGTATSPVTTPDPSTTAPVPPVSQSPDDPGDLNDDRATPSEEQDPEPTPKRQVAEVRPSARARAVKWAGEHKVAAASTATAAAVGVGAAVKAIAAKGLVSGMGGTPGGGHGLGSLLDKLHHLRHGRRLRRGGRGGADTELIRKRKARGEGTPRERSGMHSDILRELETKYQPQYEDPLDKFDDAA